MQNAEGQKRVCEAVLECLRLTCAYSAYIHTYAPLAAAPFSILMIVVERHESVSFSLLDSADSRRTYVSLFL